MEKGKELQGYTISGNSIKAERLKGLKNGKTMLKEKRR